jgi:type VI secretion system Hcp family effector
MYKRYLALEGIQGNAELGPHKGVVELLAFHWGVEQEEISERCFHVRFHNLRIHKVVDRTSPHLASACAQGRLFREASLLVACEISGCLEVFYRILLGEVFIRRVEVLPPIREGMGGAQETPREVVCLDYGEIRWEFLEFDKAGRKKGLTTRGYSTKMAKGL